VGLDRSGALVLRLKDGKVQKILSGDVTQRT
jgi:biotin-(acetyl-CoA carboxylase) ligase